MRSGSKIKKLLASKALGSAVQNRAQCVLFSRVVNGTTGLSTIIGPQHTATYAAPVVQGDGTLGTEPGIDSDGFLLGGPQYTSIDDGDIIEISSGYDAETGALTEGAGTSIKGLYRNSFTSVSGISYTFSRKVVQGARRYVQLTGALGIFGSSQYCNFDLSNGEITAEVGGVGRISTSNGIYEISFTVIATVSNTSISCYLLSIDSGTSGRAAAVAPVAGIAYYTFEDMVVASPYQHPYLAKGLTSGFSGSNSGGNGLSWPLTGSAAAERITNALGGPYTVGAVVRLGDAGVNLAAGTYNVLSCDGTVDSVLAFSNTDVAAISRHEPFLLMRETSADGTTMRDGICPYPFTTTAWGSSVSAASYTIGSSLQFAYGITAPIGASFFGGYDVGEGSEYLRQAVRRYCL